MTPSELGQLATSRNGWLLDTNIIGAVLGNKPVPHGIADFFATISDEHLWLSVITLGEIRKGIERIPRGDAVKQRLRLTLQRKALLLQERWAERILPIDLPVADRWGTLLGRYRGSGQELPAIDALIAATADVHNLIIVSHDAVFSRLRDVIHYDPYSADLR